MTIGSSQEEMTEEKEKGGAGRGTTPTSCACRPGEARQLMQDSRGEKGLIVGTPFFILRREGKRRKKKARLSAPGMRGVIFSRPSE